MDTTAFPLLARIHSMTDRGGVAAPELLAAVAVLVRAADPIHAERLVPRPGEAPALVARLAVWALRRTDATAIAAASQILGQTPTVDEQTQTTISYEVASPAATRAPALCV